MRKNLLLVLAIAVSIMSCQNYDDQFNDLNAQITALATQVTGLSEVQTDLTTLAGTVSSLQTSITDNGTALASGLDGLQGQIDALTTQLSTVASAEDVTAINDALDGVKGDLNDLLVSSNVFNGNLTITSAATLEFAQSLKGKVAIINGDVTIELDTEMDAVALQEVVTQIKTITKNLIVRAKSSSTEALVFDSLTGVTDLKIAQAGSIQFPVLKSAGVVIIGGNYASKLTGAVNFGALEQVKSIITATIGVDYTASGSETNTISLNKMSSLDLGALKYLTNAKLTIKGDQDTTVNLQALKSTDANGKDKKITLTVDGAAAIDIPGLVLGTVDVTNVKDVTLNAFSGTVTVKAGVENVTVGALADGFDATTAADLETLNLTMDAADKTIDLTGATSLMSVDISGKVKTITLSGNSDLDTLVISAAVEVLTIENSNLSVVDLTYTNSNLAENGTLTVKDNLDLTSFSANSVNGLANLTITGNADLETISFDALKAVPTKDGKADVTVGGDGKANGLNATDIVQDGVGSGEGAFTSDSGINTLKTFLTEAAKNSGSVLKVYFDTADDFTDGTNTEVDLKISAANDVKHLTVVDRDSSTGAAASKRAFVVTTTGSGTLHVNGTQIALSAGATSADFVSLLLTANNVTQLKNNGVTLTANANGSPSATAKTAISGTTTITGVGPATSQADAEKVTLTIGDYSSTVYLSTGTIGDANVEIDVNGKSAKSNFDSVTGLTTVDAVLALIAADFGELSGSSSNTFSAYTATVTTGGASGTLTIDAKDLSNAHHGKAIQFTASSGLNLGKLNINTVVAEDDTLIGTDPVIIVESDVAGLTLSAIGNPKDTEATGTGKTQLTLPSGTAKELTNGATVNDSNSVTNEGKNSSQAASTTDRSSWLAG